MGLMIDGVWKDEWTETAQDKQRFAESAVKCRNWVTPDGTPGRTGRGGFPAEPERYHLYVSYACPWAHRTLIYRKLKGLEDILPISVVHWHLQNKGWSFAPEPQGLVGDNVHDFAFAHQLYARSDPSYSGRVTVPILWDTEEETIVSNESSDIMDMLNSAFDGIGANEVNFVPDTHREDIAALNKLILETVNSGVYKAGFATTQQEYDAAIDPLFATLDWLEEMLATSRYLLGDTPLDPDWRLFPTLCRFDAVYVGHFKCDRRRLIDYPNLWAYARDLYQQPGIAETVRMDHIRQFFYLSHKHINPRGILSTGPAVDWTAPHGRAALSERAAKAAPSSPPRRKAS